MSFTIEHERTQYPVGHGFFHVGALKDLSGSNETVVYAYDCGASPRRPGALYDAIRRYREQWGDQRLNMLFVSHLHADHVWGLDRLLGTAGAETVVLPYIAPLERLCLVLEALHADEGLSSLQLAADPAGFFLARGVDKIIMVMGGPDDLPFEGERPRTPPAGGGGQDFKKLKDEYHAKLAHDLSFNQDRPTKFKPSAGQPSQVELVQHNFNLYNSPGLFDWCFRAYVRHADVNRLLDFRKSLVEVLKKSTSTGNKAELDLLQRVLRDAQLRKDLKQAYNAVHGATNFNRTSMCLYSGPASSSGNWLQCFKADGSQCYHSLAPNARIGWLGTGDAELTPSDEAIKFLRHYQNVADRVATFAVPHHGARGNFCEEIYKGDTHTKGLSPVLAYASVPKRSEHHPSPEIVHLHQRYGMRLVSITDRPGDLLIERYYR